MKIKQLSDKYLLFLHENSPDNNQCASQLHDLTDSEKFRLFALLTNKRKVVGNG